MLPVIVLCRIEYKIDEVALLVYDLAELLDDGPYIYSRRQGLDNRRGCLLSCHA
jgi:hypothetical protein